MSIEVVLLTPVLLGCIFTILGAFRFVEARDQVNSLAQAAARSASLTTTKADAVVAGERAARNAVTDRGRSCRTLDVTVETKDFSPGGAMRVTVTCTADLSDIVGLGLPGSRTFTSTAVVPIDAHRVLP